jgi:hypothetical protein
MSATWDAHRNTNVRPGPLGAMLPTSGAFVHARQFAGQSGNTLAQHDRMVLTKPHWVVGHDSERGFVDLVAMSRTMTTSFRQCIGVGQP